MSLSQLKTPTKVIALLLTVVAGFIAFNLVTNAQPTLALHTEGLQSMMNTPIAYAQAGAVVNGQCGSQNLATVATQPTGSRACAAGDIASMQFSSIAPAGWTWVCNGSGGGVDRVALAGAGVYTSPPPNTPPIANAGPNQTITLPDNNTIPTGVVATDPEGPVTIAWRKLGTGGTITGGNTTSPTFDNLIATTYLFTMRVTDMGGLFTEDTMMLTVNPNQTPPNTPPTAIAGVDRVITLPDDDTTAIGARATDLGGWIVSSQWTKVGGPRDGGITDGSNGYIPTFGNLVAGTYTFRLTVTDNGGLSHFDDMQVVVNPVTNPTCTLGPEFRAGDFDGWGDVRNNQMCNRLNYVKVANGGTGLYANHETARVEFNGNPASRCVIFAQRCTGTPPPPNVRPVANAGDDRTITIPNTATANRASARDTDGSITSIAWRKFGGTPGGSITGGSTLTPTFSNLNNPGTYVFQMVVTDNDGATHTDTMQVVVSAPGVSCTLGPQLSASGNYGPGPGCLSANDLVEFTPPNLPSCPSGASQGSVINVSSSLLNPGCSVGLTQVGSCQATALYHQCQGTLPPNTPPNVNAGADQFIFLGDDAYASGATASDSDGIQTINWNKVGILPLGGNIQNGNGTSPTFFDLTNLGTYTFRMTVRDNLGAVATDTMRVVVGPAQLLPGLPINCVGSWVNTGSCSESCGPGTRPQEYQVATPALNGGLACPVTNGATRQVPCSQGSCVIVTPDVDCVPTWSVVPNMCSASCGAGSQTERVTAITPATGAGVCSVVLGETRAGGSCYAGPCMNINADTCQILNASSTCSVNVSWSSSQVTTPQNVSVRRGSVSFATAQLNGSREQTLNHNVNTVFGIYDLGWSSSAVDSVSRNAGCVANNIWVGGTCRLDIGPAPTAPNDLKINIQPEQTLFRSGTVAQVSGEINTDDTLNCNLTAFGQGLSFATTPPAVTNSANIQGILNNQNTFLLKCDTRSTEAFSDGSTSVEVTRIVDVIPTFEEI